MSAFGLMLYLVMLNSYFTYVMTKESTECLQPPDFYRTDFPPVFFTSCYITAADNLLQDKFTNPPQPSFWFFYYLSSKKVITSPLKILCVCYPRTDPWSTAPKADALPTELLKITSDLTLTCDIQNQEVPNKFTNNYM